MQFAVKQGADRWAVAVCLITTVLALPVHSHAADFAFGDVRDPVRRCEMAGFIALPSSDVCLRVGGHVRMVSSAVEDDWNGNNDYYVRNIAIGGYTVPPSGLLPQVNFEFQDSPFNMYAQGRLHLDARLATDYGTVRAFIEGQAEDNDARTGGPFNLRHALVQFGNWTLGKTWSTFIDRDARVRRADPYKVVGDNGRSMRRNQIRYTQEFGGGFSVALAAEDQNYNTPPSAVVGVGPFVPITSPATTAVSVVNDRNNMPDLVATLRWEVEEVGSVQLSGALHQNRYAELQTIGGTQVQSYADDDLGFALLFGLVLKPPNREYDQFTFLAVYTDGASQYLQDVYGSSTEISWGRCGPVNCILDQVTKKSVVSSYTHYWTESISISFGAGYAETSYGAIGTATAGLLGTPSVLDVSSFEGFANLQWEGPSKTKIMFDVHYGHIDYNGFDVNPAVSGVQDSAGAWAATFEVTREF